MPYIITTTNPDLRAAFDEAGGRGVDLAELIDAAESRTAVAMLDEARQVADRIVGVNPVRALGQINDLTDSGGSVGPLPDGTVIEVTPIEWDELAARAGLTYPAIVGGYATREPHGNSAGQILAAFNAAQ